MNRRLLQTIVLTAVSGLFLITPYCAVCEQLVAVDDDQLQFPIITRQPEDQAISLGSNVTLTANAANADGYQWVRNGSVMDGQTNSTLKLENVAIEDVGLYTCYAFKDSEAVPTRTANLNVFMATAGDTITVFGTPVLGGGSQGSCPGPYVGYVNYTKTVAQGWGWSPSAGTTVHTASDGSGRTDTKIQYGGKYGDNGCDQTSVTVPHPTFSPKYRFAIYFTNNVPTNAYPMVLDGFNP